MRSRDALGRRRSCCRQRAASASQIGRFETEWLASGKNFVALTDLCGRWIDHVHGQRPHKAIVLDMDTSVSPTDGEQEGTSCNGHSGCTCYRPLFVFKPVRRSGTHFESGNVHSADGWHDVLEPVVARDKKRNMRRYFRSDAAFANPRVYEFLEAEGYKYAIRLPANQVLFIPVLASSSPTCHAQPKASSASTISAAQPSNG